VSKIEDQEISFDNISLLQVRRTALNSVFLLERNPTLCNIPGPCPDSCLFTHVPSTTELNKQKNDIAVPENRSVPRNIYYQFTYKSLLIRLLGIVCDYSLGTEFP